MRDQDQNLTGVHSAFAHAEAILAPLRSSAAPLLTWHGGAGERVELSGRVFDNWVAKSANLLAEEFDLSPGDRVLLDLPPHWKSLALAFAVWQRGGTVLFDPMATAELVITDRAAELTDLRSAAGQAHGELLAVALGSLALKYDGDLPPGALDYASEVRTFGDLCFPEAVLPSTPALGSAEAAGSLDVATLFGDDHATAADAATARGTTALATDSLERAARTAVVLFKRKDALVLFGRNREGQGVEAREGLLAQERVETVLS